MTVDPYLGIYIGLAIWVGIALLGGWFAGLFEKTPEKEPTNIAAE